MDSEGPKGTANLQPFVVERGTGRTTLRLRGEIDAAVAPALRTVLAEIVDEAAPLLRIDMAEVEFIDSVGISVLVAAHNRMTGRGLGFEVASIPDGCRRVFEITRLTDVFTIVP